MGERSRYLIKNVGILTISNFASKILVFLLVPLYTSVLSTNEVGKYDLTVSTVSLLFPILTLNILDALMRFLMDKATSKKEVTLIGIRYVSISLIPVLLFLFIASKFELFKIIHGFEAYIFLYYLFNCSNQYFIQFAKGIELVRAMGIAGVIGTIVTLGTNLLFLLVFKLGLPGFFIANILGQAFPAFYLLCKTRIWEYLHYTKYNKELNREMLKYCVPLIATAVGWWVNSAADKYIVSIACGVAANGILSVSYKIPAIINTVQTIFIQAWQISAIREYGEQDVAAFYGKTFSALNFVMISVCSFLIIFTKPIGKILYQKEFYSAWQFVPFLLIASVINSASGFIGPILSAKKASKPMALSAVYGGIINIVLNIILVYIIGIQGATIATLVSSLVIYYVRKKSVSKDIIIEKYHTILIGWSLLCVQAVIEIYTKFMWLEILLLVVMLLLNYKTMRYVSSIFKQLVVHHNKT